MMTSINIVDFLKEEFFISRLEENSKETVLKELLQPLVHAGVINSESLVLETLIKRETLGSTGIGKGIAIPHCRTLAISNLYIVVGISTKGIDYQAIDRKHVHLFFLILAPPNEEESRYLPVLGKIVEIVRNSKIRRSLIKAKDYTSMINIIKKE
ncbi:PTS sugar transporter subunit IIA [bacterium]|nr:PTS sugar transporter subunit IIA [bacterium]